MGRFGSKVDEREMVMGKRVWTFGLGKSLSWAGVVLLAVSGVPLACGSDQATQPRTDAGASGQHAGGGPGQGQGFGDAGDSFTPVGGSGSPVTPGDQVCKSDDDCRGSEKPVCDQVQGCVACQYDWDCPANHRCEGNECFEKRPCGTSSECVDPARPVCDGVQQICVGCREHSDCGASERCDASECVAFAACTNSRDCAGGNVCDRTVGACVACVVDGDCGEDSACVKNACVPTCASDKECLGIGLLCDLGLGRCVECLGHADCPLQYHCAASTCTLDACESGQTRCESESLLAACSEHGDAWLTSTCGSSSRCSEDEQTASCVPLLCTPSGASCSENGAAIVHCAADGMSIESTEPCLEGKACRNGACVDVICPPGEALCIGSNLYQCNANGTEQTYVESCGGLFGGTCNPTTKACEDWVCEPGFETCDGDVATICREDGLGPEPGGTDCRALNQTCYGGLCRNVVCEGEYVCESGVLERCVNEGTSVQTVQNCNHPALCDAAGGKCITPTCTPGAFVCDGSVATRCKPDGSGHVADGQDCADSDMVCDGGGCLPEVCTANTTYCLGGSPVKCGASGATYTPLDTCSAGEFCSEGSRYCLADKCTAGAAVCSGNLLTTCASDGSGPIPGGSDCSEDDKVCEAGACVGVVCAPGSYTCQGEAVYVCKPSGTGTTLYDTCASSEYCDSSGEAAVCVPDVCIAGALGCDGEVIATCDSNGGSWTSPGANCKTGGQVCILGGSCADEEIAIQGSTTYDATYDTNATQLGVFRVLASRTLTKLETQVSFQGLQKVTWVVYEKRAGAETYDLVYQKVTSHSMAVAGPLSSPVLDFVLEKGKTYAVGVHVTGDASFAYQYSSSSTAYVFKAAFLTGAFAVNAGGNVQPDATLSAYSSSTKVYLGMTTAVTP
jgi:hypothetical protein